MPKLCPIQVNITFTNETSSIQVINCRNNQNVTKLKKMVHDVSKICLFRNENLKIAGIATIQGTKMSTKRWPDKMTTENKLRKYNNYCFC